jgi:hypothetical protein
VSPMHPRTPSQPCAAALLGELMRFLLHDRPGRTADATTLLRRLDEGLMVYEIEYRGFLNGQGQRPPIELQAALSAAFHELGQHTQGRLGFRLDSLEARYHASERLLRQRQARGDRAPWVPRTHSSTS